MRQKRAKAYRKLMSLYCMSFGFRQPYQVLVDSLICKEATNQKVDLAKQLGNVLQGAVKPMITQCSIHELYLQGKEMQPAVDLAKTFERRKCNHKEAIPGDECLASVVGEANKHRYVIATQSQPVRHKLRLIPAVPIVHINRAVMVLEPPSDATTSAKESAEEKKLLPSQPESSVLVALSGATAARTALPKKKGPKGPNPLSVKKKKVKTGEVRRLGGDRIRGIGKEPESEKGHAGDGLQGDDQVEIGKKRRRDDGDVAVPETRPVETGNEASGGGAINEEGHGHKRRRRRKNAKVEDVPG